MTVVINQTLTEGVCDTTDSFDITDPLITAFVAALPTPDHTLDLIVKVNGGDEIVIAITDANPNLDTGTDTYTLTPSDVNQTASLSDGIYDLHLRKTVTVGGSTTSEFECVFVDCKTSCKVKTYNVNNEDAKAGVLYTILTVQDNCSQCSCDNSATIFNKLNNLLNATNSCEC